MEVPFVVTLRDDNEAGPMKRTHRLPAITCRKQPIARQDFICRSDNDIKVTVKITVLKSVIEDDDLCAEVFDRIACPACTLFINDDHDATQFCTELRRLIPRRIRLRTHDAAIAYNNGPAALALVSTADDRDLSTSLRQPPSEQFNERCFADSADGDISHRDYGNSDSPRSQNPNVKEQISKRHPNAIQIRERKKKDAHTVQIEAA
jgi:hypothetical protein